MADKLSDFKNMKILVTGATGFIGFEVSHQLSSMGMRPRLMSRRPGRGSLISSLDAEIIEGDLMNEESLRKAVKGVDAIIHLAARATFEDYATLHPTIVKGSVSLMQAAAEEGVENFIYSSSMVVYDSQPDYIDDKTEARPSLGYGKAKLEAENLMSDIANDAGINLGILRLPHIYGAQDLLFGHIRGGYFILPGNGNNLFSHMHVEDAARLLILAALKGWSGASPVADNQPCSWNEFIGTVVEYYPGLKVYRVPKIVSLLAVNLFKTFNIISRKPTLSTSGTIDGFNLNLKIEPGLVWTDLKAEPKYPTVFEGIPAVLDGFVAYRWRHPLHDRAN